MNSSRHPKSCPCLLILLALAFFVIRITGPDDLEDNSQARNVGYAVDLVDHGHWLVQRDLQNRIQSKPPLHTWMIGVLAAPFGLNRLTLTLPSFAAVAGMMLLVFHIGKMRFGLLAGIVSGLAMIMCPLMWRQIGMVRSDAVFALAIAGGAWAAFRAWETGKGWTMFWFCGAVSLLTKGPLGLLLSSVGLLAWFWERQAHGPQPGLSGSHRRGLLIFLTLCLAWAVPALWFHGGDLVDQMIYRELLGHTVVPNDHHGNVVMRVLTPTINFLTRFAPFSLFSGAAIIRSFRRPSEHSGERRLERFLVCWILAGMMIFTLSAHHRADLLLPLWPAGALLAGFEASRLAVRAGERKFAWAATIAGSLLLAGAWFKYHPLPGQQLRSAAYSQQIREAAGAFRNTGIDPHHLHNLSLPATFQYYLGSSEKATTPQRLIEGLKRGEKAWVGTGSLPLDITAFHGIEVIEAFRWPLAPHQKPVVQIYEVLWP